MTYNEIMSKATLASTLISMNAGSGAATIAFGIATLGFTLASYLEQSGNEATVEAGEKFEFDPEIFS